MNEITSIFQWNCFVEEINKDNNKTQRLIIIFQYVDILIKFVKKKISPIQ